MFKYLRMRSLYEFIKVISRLKNFNKINRLMHLTKVTISGNCYRVLKLNFNILNFIFLLIKLTVDLLKLFIDLFKAFIHFLLHLIKVFIYLLLYFFKMFIYFLFHLFKAFIYLFLHFVKPRCNKLILTKKFLPHFFIVGIKCLV